MKCKFFDSFLTTILTEEFCEVMMGFINENQSILHDICCTDECTSSLNGYVNQHTWKSHTPNQEKVNVWSDVLGKTFEENLIN